MIKPVNRLFAVLLITLTVAVLAGCLGSSPVTRYYAFEVSDVMEETRSDDTVIISVGPFEVPDYLNRPQVVIRDQGTQLKVLKYDRWAEPLKEAITRRLTIKLSNQVPSALAYQFPSTTDLSPDYRVRGRLINFEAGPDGTVILRVRWAMLNRNGDFIIGPLGDSFTTTVNSVDDVPAVTEAMNQLLDEFGQKIAADINALELSPE